MQILTLQVCLRAFFLLISESILLLVEPEFLLLFSYSDHATWKSHQNGLSGQRCTAAAQITVGFTGAAWRQAGVQVNCQYVLCCPTLR